MVYIFSTNLENRKKVEVALQGIYGIGSKQAFDICAQLGISHSIRIKQLTTTQLEKLTNLIGQNKVLGIELKQQKRKNIQRLVKIACYRGFRHTEGLPCRGQRTHGNGRTARKMKSKVRVKK